jgi:hypothetical protein|tara:strand:+ start:2581 stop:2958 length:378 start_codon:yes stop_codon:yes gene_type:complete
MKSKFALLWPLLLAVAVIFPAFGPAIDHHFAERDPAHRHVGAAPSHDHDFARQHGHNADSTGNPTAVLSLDGGAASPAAVVLDDTHLAHSLKFEPSSVWSLMTWDRISFQDHYSSPPKRPPQPLA